MPRQLAYADFMQTGSNDVAQVVYRSHNRGMDRLFRWRKDGEEGIHGGKRRTFLLPPRSLIDWPVFGGSGRYASVMQECADAANQAAAHIGLEEWRVNRIITNFMGPNTTIEPHVDPTHFRDGVIVFGIGEAVLKLDSGELANPHESITFIPAGQRHSVQNGPEERISIVTAHDTQIAAGKTATGQFLHGLLSRP